MHFQSWQARFFTIVGIGVAVDNYNQKALSSNLEEHFGNIKLSAQEVQDIASGILDQKYLANVEVALNEVKNADKLREDAQKALESNDVLEFKSRVGIKLTTEEQEDYTSNIETFVKSKIEELESRTFAAHIHVQTYLGGTEEGQTLAQNIEKWATADYVELDGLSSQLSQKVSEALKDGIIDADEEGAISALQEKMNSITARWKESEAQAKWDWINQEYGSLNAADLESGSFTDLLGAMRDQRQSATRECQAFEEPCTFGEGESFYDTMTGEVDYGFMYHGITYADEAVLEEDKGKMTVRFWKPVMKKGGIIEFIKPEECTQKRHIREMERKIFGKDNFTGLKEFTSEEVGE